VPLLLTNGWPRCFLEYVDVLDALSDGAGDEPTLGFNVVVPTIPGYGHSDHAFDAGSTKTRSPISGSSS
jgi:hypothetical protein